MVGFLQICFTEDLFFLLSWINPLSPDGLSQIFAACLPLLQSPRPACLLPFRVCRLSVRTRGPVLPGRLPRPLPFFPFSRTFGPAFCSVVPVGCTMPPHPFLPSIIPYSAFLLGLRRLLGWCVKASCSPPKSPPESEGSPKRVVSRACRGLCPAPFSSLSRFFPHYGFQLNIYFSLLVLFSIPPVTLFPVNPFLQSWAVPFLS